MLQREFTSLAYSIDLVSPTQAVCMLRSRDLQATLVHEVHEALFLKPGISPESPFF